MGVGCPEKTVEGGPSGSFFVRAWRSFFGSRVKAAVKGGEELSVDQDLIDRLRALKNSDETTHEEVAVFGSWIIELGRYKERLDRGDVLSSFDAGDFKYLKEQALKVVARR